MGNELNRYYSNDYLLENRQVRQAIDQLNVLRDNDLFLRKWRSVFSTPDGLDILEFLLNLCMRKFSVMTGNSGTFYNAALRDLGGQFEQLTIAASPELMARIIGREAKRTHERLAQQRQDLEKTTRRKNP